MRAFWKALANVSVLDPTCGSGAFLFAALNILEPIYSTCLEAMEGFLDDLERSQRPHSPQALSDFRKVLAQVADHASKDYFILKSIIIGNLYGVDIMEEAVEICKLRLFLKLVAQLDRLTTRSNRSPTSTSTYAPATPSSASPPSTRSNAPSGATGSRSSRCPTSRSAPNSPTAPSARSAKCRPITAWTRASSPSPSWS